MARAVEERVVHSGRDRIWETLSDFAAISSWAPNVDHSSLTTEQADGVGAVRRVQVGRNTVLERIVDWQAGEALSYEIDGMPPVVRSATNTWRLEDAGGSTRVSLTTDVDAGPRPPQQLIARVICRVLAKQSRRMLTGLATHAEEASR